MIDVIIPAYNSHKYIDNVLTSLSLQTITDKFEVTIVNDGSKEDYSKIISFYNEFIKVKEIGYKDNKGPGYARRYGINNTHNKYIVFIDSDDVLYDRFSLQNLYNEIENNNLDYVNSLFYEELNETFYPKEKDDVWLHGKIYRREFLSDNNINFNDSRCNEDNGFNTLVLLSKPKKKYFYQATYIWKSNMNSITRSNDYEYQFTGLSGFIYNITWALNLKKDNKEISYDIAKIAMQTLYYLYFCYLKFNKTKAFDELINKSKDLYNLSIVYDFNSYELGNILDEEFNKIHKYFDKNIIYNPIITFNEFLKMVGDNK